MLTSPMFRLLVLTDLVSVSRHQPLKRVSPDDEGDHLGVLGRLQQLLLAGSPINASGQGDQRLLALLQVGVLHPAQLVEDVCPAVLSEIPSKNAPTGQRKILFVPRAAGLEHVAPDKSMFSVHEVLPWVHPYINGRL